MSDWLPSLNSLRAFEVVSRRLNYVHSAEELSVTPAAVKQLVSKLEATIGKKLVNRDGRNLALSDAGKSCQGALTAGFDQIQEAVNMMREQKNCHQLIVSVEPSFATAWLVPRLDRFRSDNEATNVLIDSSLKIVNLKRGAADLAIRFGSKTEIDLVSCRLFDEELCAFCSPSLTTGKNGIRKLEDLQNINLLHWDLSQLSGALETKRWMDWKQWLHEIGSEQISSSRGMRFNDYNLAVQAAVAGQGVVLGSLPVLQDLVEAGLLVRPFEERIVTDIGYDIVATKSALQKPEVRAFWDWITEETSRQSKQASFSRLTTSCTFSP